MVVTNGLIGTVLPNASRMPPTTETNPNSELSSAPTRGEASLTSVYGQLSMRPADGLTIIGGVRHDDHERYGGQTLFAAGATWALPTGTTLRAAYSEGFKAPSLYQLFSYETRAIGMFVQAADLDFLPGPRSA